MIVFVRSSSVTEEVVGIWQPMVSRIEMVEAYLRFVKVGKFVESKTMQSIARFLDLARSREI